MKKYIICLMIICIAALVGRSQDNHFRRVSVIPMAGVTLSEPYKGADAIKVGFTVGSGVEISLAENSSRVGLALFTGLELASKPFKGAGMKSNPCYLQLPLMIGVKRAMRYDIDLDFYAGGYIAERLWGNLEGDAAKLKNFDCGLRFEAGITKCRIRLSAYCERGFRRMTDAPVSYHNFDAGIRLGYTF